MSYRDGKRRGRGPRMMPGRARRGPGANGTAPPRRSTAPIGSLVIQKNGEGQFYPVGGRDRPPIRRDPNPSPPMRSKESVPPFGSQSVYFNRTFDMEPKFDPYTAVPMGTPSDDDVSFASDDAPPISPKLATTRAIFVCCCVSVIVVIVVVVAIIFPVIFIASNATGASVTGTVRLNTMFDSAFDDVTSIMYTSQVTTFEDAMNQIFEENSTFSDDFRGTSVTDLESGPSMSTTEVSFTVTFNVGTVDTPLLRNELFAFVSTEIARSGSPLAALPIVPGTLQIAESCNIYCVGGTLTIADCTCA